MDSSKSVEKSIAELNHQEKKLNTLIQDFKSLINEIDELQVKAQDDSIAAENLVKVEKVLESHLEPTEALIKSSFSDLKNKSLQLQQSLETLDPLQTFSSSESKVNKKKAQPFI